jgi:hypothetical protein
MEILEGRQLMAADIQGLVYHDANNNSVVDAAETRLSGIPVQLFLDNGDGIFGSSDTLKASTTSGSNGAYSLTAETAGTYFVVQNSEPAGFVQRQNQRVQKLTLAAADILRHLQPRKLSVQNAMCSSMRPRAPSALPPTGLQNQVNWFST